MKIAFAGKGGTGKTTIAAWTGDYLARQGYDVWLIDADTAMSLGRASGLTEEEIPSPLTEYKEIIEERIGIGLLNLNPEVKDLPEKLSVEVPIIGETIAKISPGRKRLLVMGTVQSAGSGCACGANALLKALLAHLLYEDNVWIIIDLEAGVEHLGRGTIEKVDVLAIVSELSLRSFETAKKVSKLSYELGLQDQLLLLNRVQDEKIFETAAQELKNGLPEKFVIFPEYQGLFTNMLESASVMNLPEREVIDQIIKEMIAMIS